MGNDPGTLPDFATLYPQGATSPSAVSTRRGRGRSGHGTWVWVGTQVPPYQAHSRREVPMTREPSADTVGVLRLVPSLAECGHRPVTGGGIATRSPRNAPRPCLGPTVNDAADTLVPAIHIKVVARPRGPVVPPSTRPQEQLVIPCRIGQHCERPRQGIRDLSREWFQSVRLGHVRIPHTTQRQVQSLGIAPPMSAWSRPSWPRG
jgi:hypothetical protein